MQQASKLSEMAQADKDREPFITLSFESEREHVHNYVCVCIDIFLHRYISTENLNLDKNNFIKLVENF